MGISVVINTFNEEKNIKRAIESVLWADEIIVCDMHSSDKTVEEASKMGAKIVNHKMMDYVEPARNFAISKASNEWILILDADEEIPLSLAEEIQKMLKKEIVSDYVEIPRMNIIFNKWMKASMWWPDYNIRFFKKGKVIWSDKIHSKPKALGQGLKLPEDESLAIIHHNYQNLSQYISRMNRYTTIEADILKNEGYKFDWKDLMNKPLGEFLSRFFANQGYKDGLHGFSLSILQAFSFFVLYLKTWEREDYKEVEIKLSEIEHEKEKAGEAIKYWFLHTKLSKNPVTNIINKIKYKF